MTPDAQSALRRIIEAYSKVTRFCLVCNYVTRVIEPLASRCAKFRFRPLPVDSMKNRMREIAGCEGIQLTEATLEAILQASNGDMRKAVTFLQSAHQLSGGLSSISPEVVIDISGKVSSGDVCTRSCECKTTRICIRAQVPPAVLEKLWKSMASNTFDVLRGTVADIMYEGYALAAILSQLHDAVVGKPTAQLADVDKALICEKIAEVEQNLVDGASESLQLLDLTAFIMRRLCANPAEVDSLTSATH
jgi:replication factor C subunit 2/4